MTKYLLLFVFVISSKAMKRAVAPLSKEYSPPMIGCNGATDTHILGVREKCDSPLVSDEYAAEEHIMVTENSPAIADSNVAKQTQEQ